MTPEQITSLVYGFYSLMAPQELSWLYNVIERLKLKNGLEIGVACGASLLIWERLGGLIVGIDNDGQNKAYGMLTRFIEIGEKKNLKLILGNSDASEVVKKAKEYFPDRTVDFLFIDGWHSYEAVKQDYLNYGPMVRPRGIIVIHDIAHVEAGVKRFWEELLKENGNLRTEEFKDHNGIGVIHVEK